MSLTLTSSLCSMTSAEAVKINSMFEKVRHTERNLEEEKNRKGFGAVPLIGLCQERHSHMNVHIFFIGDRKALSESATKVVRKHTLLLVVCKVASYDKGLKQQHP